MKDKERYISPSNIIAYKKIMKGDTFFTTPTDYLARYVFDIKPDYIVSDAADIGTCFDGFVKEALIKHFPDCIHGYKGDDIKSILPARILSNGDVQGAGYRLFTAYKETGALADLILWAEKRGGNVGMEASAKCYLPDGSGGQILVFGLPDFYVEEGHFDVIDWKVNGGANLITGKGGASVKGSYLGASLSRVYPAGGRAPREKDIPFEEVCWDWSVQTTIYSWVLSKNASIDIVGDGKFIPLNVGIDQVAVKDGVIRFCAHRPTISVGFQEDLLKSIQHIYASVGEARLLLEAVKKEELDWDAFSTSDICGDFNLTAKDVEDAWTEVNTLVALPDLGACL